MASVCIFMLVSYLWYDFDRLKYNLDKGSSTAIKGGSMAFFIFCIILGLLLLIYMAREAFTNRIVFQDIYFRNFPSSFGRITIFFISDIHRRAISDKIINEAIGKTDLVIIGGDLTEKGVPIQQVTENIKKLKRIGPIYFVWGNNDYEGDSHLLDATLLDLGVKILDNTAVTFESTKGDQFQLLGVDDLAKERDRLDLALKDAGENGFRLLVSHNPEIIKKIDPSYDIHFILSGHTHGGQIRIFGFGPYEKGGIKNFNHITLLTSNGYGTTGLPLRLGAKSETHLITLCHGENVASSMTVKVL